MSVSLALIETDPPRSSDADVRNYWAESFNDSTAEPGSEDEPHNHKGGGEPKEGEEKTLPKKVNGIGEDAFWLANRFGGALYVLKADVIIRVSVGGPATEEEKLERCEALAGKLFPRLKPN